jgi:CRISPR/Cas system-associated exonuclease Cas4 (RecB family)
MRSGLMRELGAKRIVPSFVVITKGAKPKVQILRPVVGQADVSRLKTQVAEVMGAIRSGVYIRREGWQCKGCPYRDQCHGH